MARPSNSNVQQWLNSLEPEVLAGIAVFLLILVLGIAYTLTLPRLYQSHARLWVMPRVANDFSGSSGPSFAPFYNSFTSPMTTAVEVVRSQSVVRRAAEALATAGVHPTVTPGEISAGLKAAPVREADILDVSFASADRQLTAKVVKAVVDSFLRTASAQNAGDTENVYTFLQTEEADAKRNYEVSRNRLADFQNRNRAVNLSEQTSELLRQQSEVASDLKNSRTHLAEVESRLSFLQHQAGVTAENALDVETLTSDEVIQELKAKIASQQVHLVDVRTHYTADSPQLRRAESALQKMEQALKARVGALSREGAGSLIENVQNTGPLKRTILEDLVRARAEELEQATRIESLQRVAAELDSKLRAIPQEQMQLADLSAQQQLTAARLAEVGKRLQSARLAESLTNRQSNIKVIEEPEVPNEPSVPNIPVYLLVCLAAAAGGGFGTWYLMGLRNPRVRSAGEVSAIMPFSIVSCFKAQRRENGLNTIVTPMDRLRQYVVDTTLKAGNKFITVVSADGQSDKDLVAAGLAESLARAGLKVVLVDTNLFNPNLHNVFNVPNTPGLVQCISGSDIVLHGISSRLKLVSAGATQGRSYGLWLRGPVFSQMMQDFAAQADAVIFDTSPTTSSSDAIALLQPEGQTIIVVKIGQTPRVALKAMAQDLRQHGLQNAAIVLSNTEELHSGLTSQSPAPGQRTGESDLPASTVAAW